LAQGSEVEDLLKDADAAVQANDINFALNRLRAAVGRAPNDGTIRARLGIALLKSGDPDTAERVLRRARSDSAPSEIVVPPLLQAMLARGQTQDLLKEFPDPGPDNGDPVAADIFRSRAIALQAEGQSDEANEAIARSLALRRDTAALMTRAQLAADQDDPKLAIATADEAMKLDPHNAIPIRFKIGALLQSGDRQAALGVANDLVSRVPTSALAKLSRIEVFLDLNQDAEASKDLEAVLKLAPRSYQGRYYEALLLARTKQYHEAWRIAQILPRQITQARPDEAVMIAQMAIADGRANAAGTILRPIVAKYPKLTRARLLLSALSLLQGAASEALRLLDPINDADDPVAQALLAQAYLMQKQQPEAISALEKVAGVRNPLPNGQEGQSEFEVAKSDKAIEGFRLLVEVDPGRTEVVAPVLAALSRANRLDEALAVADRMAKAADASDPRPSFFRGQVLTLKDDLSGAMKAYDASLAIDPGYLPALYFRASVAQLRGDLMRAAGDLETILARDPKSALEYVKLDLPLKIAPRTAEIIDDLGWKSFQGLEKREALELLEGAYELDNDNPRISYHYAVALDAAGNRAAAKPVLQSALASKRNFDGLEEAKQLMAAW